MAVKAFKVKFSQKLLNDLMERLARTRFPDEIEGADWDYGTNLEYLKELINYWQTEFDWRDQEEAMSICNKII